LFVTQAMRPPSISWQTECSGIPSGLSVTTTSPGSAQSVSRVPTIIISPFAKRHSVDHTQYDTTSILRFITRRFGLPELFGNAARDAALKASGSKPMGDLTKALNLSLR
jgi:phospholipase C